MTVTHAPECLHHLEPASFNLEAVKKQIEAMIKAREGQQHAFLINTPYWEFRGTAARRSFCLRSQIKN
jgi:hypothetical protein